MSETRISHLELKWLIYLIVNSILLLAIAVVSLTMGLFYGITALIQYTIKSFPIVAGVIYLLYFLVTVAYAVVIVITSVLGFLYEDRMSKRGIIIVTVVNSILFTFFVINCAVSVTAFVLASIVRYSTVFFVPGSLGVGLGVFQFCLFVYNIFHVIVICMSFRNRSGNRQAEEYQENALVEI